MSFMKAGFIISVLLFMMGGCSLIGSVVVEDRFAHVPRMTCEQLFRNGPPADGQVTVTDVQPCKKGFVATRHDGDLDLYVPAYPAPLGREPDPPDLKLLFQVWNDDDRHK